MPRTVGLGFEAGSEQDFKLLLGSSLRILPLMKAGEGGGGEVRGIKGVTTFLELLLHWGRQGITRVIVWPYIGRRQ